MSGQKYQTQRKSASDLYSGSWPFTGAAFRTFPLRTMAYEALCWWVETILRIVIYLGS